LANSIEEMTLSIGTRLSHYEITSPLGKGGMGEVYQATDTKLGRDVAIKVLPEEFARDAERVARFQREARLLAALNHPNIASIYGIEESNGTHFIVMELVEGNTLDARIKASPVPVEEALKLALQIAEALEAAHEKGVIHRDLKPANIKETPEGKVKVLDFGLAKAFAGEQANLNLSNSPTLSQAATMQGVILGTASYMSPEQARGKPVDKRTDIWAFGCVLYEMLTGKAAFQGEDITEILAAVVKSGVNLDLLPVNIHPRVREVLTRCLQKDQKKRYADISEAQYEIEQVLADPNGVFAQPPMAAKPRRKVRVGLPWFVAAAILCVIIGGVAVWKLKPTPKARVVRLEYELPQGQQFKNLNGGAQAFALSPDGNLLIYTTPDGLYMRYLDNWTTRPLPGTEEADSPFFSPDGQWIGYISQTKLKKIAVAGGAPVTLCEAGVSGGFSWTSDNRIIQAFGESIRWVSADGGDLEPLFEEKGRLLGAPQMLPDGKSVLFTTSATAPHKIMVHSLESGKSKELFEGGFARYIKTGHIVYGVGNNLYARPFNPDTLEVTGGPVSIVEGVMSASFVWHYAVSDTGTLVYMPGTATAIPDRRTLVWLDREGKEEPVAAAPDDYRTLKISPDGTLVALSIEAGGNLDITIWDIARENMRKLIFDKSDDSYPLWAPDGKSIIFASTRNGRSLCSKASDGTGDVKAILANKRLVMPFSWSRDGKTPALTEWSGTSLDISIMSMELDHAQRPLFQERYNELYPRVSPDGRWMAYVTNEFGQEEVYVCPFPEVTKGSYKVSSNGGTSPLWSRDGRELFYWTPDALMVVPVKTASEFIYETPKVQFQRMPVSTASFGVSLIHWDISLDGKRFLMFKPASLPDATPTSATPQKKINIILNWFEELKERVPGSD
jgi:serine/threonine protein kinase